jgi:hypothetical protein
MPEEWQTGKEGFSAFEIWVSFLIGCFVIRR